MALFILDGNQSAATLSTIVVSSAHIPAHTVVSLGTQAITDIVNATSAGLTNTQLRASAVTVGGTVTIGNSLTIGGGTVTIGAGTAQIGSVTASILGTVPISISSVTIGNSITISSLPALVAGTAQIGSVTASISGTIPISISSITIGNSVTIANFPATQPISISSVTISSLPAISGTVTANVPVFADGYTAVAGIRVIGAGADGSLRIQGINPISYLGENLEEGGGIPIFSANNNPLLISGTVTVGNTVTIAGTVTANPTGTQTIAGSVTIGAGTAQIGSVTASISGTVPISISSVTVGNSVTIGSLPAISGTVTIGNAYVNFLSANQNDGNLRENINEGLVAFIAANTLPISGTVTANTFAVQGTSVATSNFTSITPSTVLANFNATREVLTIFNEGAGNLHICAGATCTTIAYQVRLSTGDYFEVPNHQTTITHSAVFATAGTARVTEVS